MEQGLACTVAGRCGGCPSISTPYAEQLTHKRDALVAAWREAGLPEAALEALTVHSAGAGGLRDRTDLTFQRVEGAPVLGLWALDRQELVPVGACPMASDALRAFMVDLAADPPPIDRASLRLRVAPDGRRGLWIDAANADIKVLLDEEAWLTRQLASAHVEMGQRRKTLFVAEDRLRLQKNPELHPWFQTWVDGADGLTPVPLFGTVGGFSQPGLATNRLLVERVLGRVRPLGAVRWLELGAGSGNFTLPLASVAAEVTAAETDPLARQGLERSAAEAGLSDRIDAISANMHRADGHLIGLVAAADAIFADPPRSGLRAFVDALAAVGSGEGPRDLVYVSCFADSLIADLARLAELGWGAVSVEGIDQFPQTEHGEWLVHLQRAG